MNLNKIPFKIRSKYNNQRLMKIKIQHKYLKIHKLNQTNNKKKYLKITIKHQSINNNSKFKQSKISNL